MILPRHIFKRMYKEFLAYERSMETAEKIDRMATDPEMQKKFTDMLYLISNEKTDSI